MVGLFASFLCGYLVANVFDLPSTIAWVNQHWVNYQNAGQDVQLVVDNAASKKPAENPKPKFEFYTLLSKDGNPAAAAAREVTLPATVTSPNTETSSRGVEAVSVESARLAAQAVPALQAVSEQGVEATRAALEAQNTASLAPAEKPSNTVVPVTESRPVSATSDVAVSKQVSKETYMIQVAAVTRRQDAERLKASLTLKGYGVMIISPSETKVNWYRVVIGPFHSRSEAEKAQLNVARSEHIQGVIRKLDV